MVSGLLRRQVGPLGQVPKFIFFLLQDAFLDTMYSAMDETIEITIDRAGRIVIPKSIRDAAGLRAGTTLCIRWQDGLIELEPVPRRVSVERRGRLAVAVPEDQGPELTCDTVRETLAQVRSRSGG